MTTKPEAIAQIEAAIGGLFPNGMASSWDVFVRREDAKDAFKAACNPKSMREVLNHIAAQAVEIARLREALTLVIERFGPGQQNYLFSKRDSLDRARAALTTKGTI